MFGKAHVGSLKGTHMLIIKLDMLENTTNISNSCYIVTKYHSPNSLDTSRKWM